MTIAYPPKLPPSASPNDLTNFIVPDPHDDVRIAIARGYDASCPTQKKYSDRAISNWQNDIMAVYGKRHFTTTTEEFIQDGKKHILKTREVMVPHKLFSAEEKRRNDEEEWLKRGEAVLREKLSSSQDLEGIA